MIFLQKITLSFYILFKNKNRLNYQIFDNLIQFDIFSIKTKYQIFDKKLKSASFVLILTDGRQGKKKINIKMVATSQRRKEKINKIILLFAVDNKTNLFYNN